MTSEVKTLSPDGVIGFAIDMAREAHHEQYRSSASGARVPYSSHPILVVHYLVSAGMQNDIVLAAAALHDVVEDCFDPSWSTEKAQEFLARQLLRRPEIDGDKALRINRLVAEVTVPRELSGDDKLGYKSKIIPSISAEAQLIIFADAIANLHSLVFEPPTWDTRRKARYFRALRERVELLMPLLLKTKINLEAAILRQRFQRLENLFTEKV